MIKENRVNLVQSDDRDSEVRQEVLVGGESQDHRANQDHLVL